MTHLEIEAGPEKGRRLRIPPQGGARVGRDSGNDIVLNDLALSRFQCRFFCKGAELWVTDLGSTNATEVNGKAVQSVPLAVGDRIVMGQSTLVVRPPDSGEEMPDLGLGPKPEAKPDRRPGRRTLLWTAVALLCAGVAVLVLIKYPGRVPSVRVAATNQPPTGLEIRYEKVQASAANIFRYELTLRNGTMAIRVDDLSNDRHIGQEKKVDPLMLGALADALDATGFFELQEEYSGLAKDIFDAWDITLTIGARTHRVRVANRVEPEAFAKARARLEDSSRTEMGLAALALPPDKLVELAKESLLQGRKLYDEREVQFANLQRAIHSYREAEVYLETVEPKPDFYPQVITGREDCRRLLQAAYDDHDFRADRAIKLRDWPEASKQLRIIMEMIPDREDKRYQQAQQRILDVQRYLGK